jgi:predicted transcriptional regulator
MGRERTDYNLARARIIAKVGARSFDVLAYLIKHARNNEALVTATEIGEALNFSRVSAHKHLRRLIDADMLTTCEWRVESIRDGRGVYRGVYTSKNKNTKRRKQGVRFPRAAARGQPMRENR